MTDVATCAVEDAVGILTVDSPPVNALGLAVRKGLSDGIVRVSRISARDGHSLLGREVPLHCVPELCQALGLENDTAFSAEQIVDAVLAAGRPMQI